MNSDEKTPQTIMRIQFASIDKQYGYGKEQKQGRLFKFFTNSQKRNDSNKFISAYR